MEKLFLSFLAILFMPCLSSCGWIQHISKSYEPDYQLIYSYSLPILTSVLAFFILAKDWKAHQNSWRRLGALVTIFLIGVVGAINVHIGQQTINSLKMIAQTAKDDQGENTKLFLDNFSKMHREISGLQSRVDNEEITKYAETLKSQIKDLTSTQKALIKPKASLSFTFPKQDLKLDDPPVRSVTLPVVNDVIHVEFDLFNKTYTPAINGKFVFQICDACQFESEPKRSVWEPGLLKTQRVFRFDSIEARSISTHYIADIRVPKGSSRIVVGVNYRCPDCDTPEVVSKGTIFLER